jgi:hypothetical protein
VLTDHYSGSVCVRYYAAMGETAANMYDFLLYAWGRKKGNVNVFHGLPELLIWDCGTANIAKATSNALKAFGVKTLPHLPGNPRAKGQVENGNNLVETQFESRLRFEPVKSIEELNDTAEYLLQAAKVGGMAALAGESGSGKTTIRRYAIDRMAAEGEKARVIAPRCVDKTRLTTSTICDAIINDCSTEAPRRTLEA